MPVALCIYVHVARLTTTYTTASMRFDTRALCIYVHVARLMTTYTTASIVRAFPQMFGECVWIWPADPPTVTRVSA